MTALTSAEIMIVNAARMLKDGDVVFVGVGQPNLACNLAKRTHAPNLVMIYEAGVIGAEPARLPLSIGDPTLVSGSLSVVSMYDIFTNYLQRGNVDVGFLGGAQIDKYGNINATVIGSDYAHPKVREAVAVGVPDAYRGETVKVFVVLKADCRADAGELQRFCRTRLAKYKLPTEIEFRRELPKSTVGKILRKQLRAEELEKRAQNILSAER